MVKPKQRSVRRAGGAKKPGALRRAKNRFGRLAEREKRLLDSIVDREYRHGVHPLEFELDASNAIHKALASRAGLKGNNRRLAVIFADGYTALWIIARESYLRKLKLGSGYIDDNVLKRLFEDAESAHRFLGQSWEARHDSATLQQVEGIRERGKEKKIFMDTKLFKKALRTALGGNFRFFMDRRAKLRRVARRRWRSQQKAAKREKKKK